MTKKELLRSRISPDKKELKPLPFLDLAGPELMSIMLQLRDIAGGILNENQKQSQHMGANNRGW